MLHTENSTQVDITFDNMQTNKSFSHSRFAIELLVVGEGNPSIPMFVNPRKSIDDEHTPGIFEVIFTERPFPCVYLVKRIAVQNNYRFRLSRLERPLINAWTTFGRRELIYSGCQYLIQVCLAM